MDINSLIGIKVEHKKFGKGVIVGVSNDKFADIDFNGQVKKFMIDSLDLFFTFEDKELETLIKKENQKEREEQARRLKEQEEKAEEVRRLKEQEIIKMEKIAKRGKTFSKGLDIRDGVLVGMGTCNLASINIPDDVTSIGESVFTTGNHPFSQYYQFKNITIPDSVKSIGFHAFYGSEIDKLTIGKGVKDIDDYAFEYTKIKKVNYLGTIDDFLQITFDYYNNPITWSGKLYIDNKLVEDIVLSKDTKLDNFSTLEQLRYIKSITVDEDNPNYKSIDGNLYTKDGKTLIKYVSAKKDKSFVIPDSVEEIMGNAFDGAKYLTKITIPDSVKIMGPEAFRHCSALKKVNYLGTIDEWAEINFGCAMENLVNSPTEFASLYINNKLVTDVVLTKATKVSRYAFIRCGAIESITIGSSVKKIEKEAFYCCASLKSVTISDGLTYIDDIAFSNCRLLEKVILPSTITYIGEQAFYDCLSLKQIEMPKVAVSIEKDAFELCDELKKAPKGTKGCPNAFGFCGTCAHWTGKRTLDERGIFVKIKDEKAQCKCVDSKCKYSQKETSYNMRRCRCYKAWKN